MRWEDVVALFEHVRKVLFPRESSRGNDTGKQLDEARKRFDRAVNDLTKKDDEVA